MTFRVYVPFDTDLDLEAMNGAELETGTVNGGFDFDFPITIQGKIGKRLNTTLGDGGRTIRVVTTNGGVKVRRGSVSRSRL